MSDLPFKIRPARASDPLLIAVSVVGYGNQMLMPPYGLCKQVNVRGSATVADVSFTFETGYLPQSVLEGFERLKEYGFTVVEPVSNSYNSDILQWRSGVIKQAIEKVEGLLMIHEDTGTNVYDEELANRVLVALGVAFPYAMTMIELKSKLIPEPSDAKLLNALEGLLVERLIEGVQLRDGNKLVDVANARITRDGRKALTGGSTSQNAVVHGDQIINYGHAGAMGRHAVGTINEYQEEWATNPVDLSQLSKELQTLKVELLKIAKTAEDYGKVSLIAQADEYAEKHNGPKVMEILSQSGKWLFDFATEVGTDITAKLLAKQMGLEH